MLLLPLPHGSMSPTASSAHAELPALLMLAVCGGKGDYVLAPVDNPREGVTCVMTTTHAQHAAQHADLR